MCTADSSCPSSLFTRTNGAAVRASGASEILLLPQAAQRPATLAIRKAQLGSVKAGEGGALSNGDERDAQLLRMLIQSLLLAPNADAHAHDEYQKSGPVVFVAPDILANIVKIMSTDHTMQ